MISGVTAIRKIFATLGELASSSSCVEKFLVYFLVESSRKFAVQLASPREYALLGSVSARGISRLAPSRGCNGRAGFEQGAWLAHSLHGLVEGRELLWIHRPPLTAWPIYGFGLRSCAWVLLVRTRAFLSDALDASDSVFFIDDFVDGLSLTAFEARYAVTGERAYPPRMLRSLARPKASTAVVRLLAGFDGTCGSGIWPAAWRRTSARSTGFGSVTVKTSPMYSVRRCIRHDARAWGIGKTSPVFSTTDIRRSDN
jgi:hypothetical protein